jgi:hypothetical protein
MTLQPSALHARMKSPPLKNVAKQMTLSGVDDMGCGSPLQNRER